MSRSSRPSGFAVSADRLQRVQLAWRKQRPWANVARVRFSRNTKGVQIVRAVRRVSLVASLGLGLLAGGLIGGFQAGAAETSPAFTKHVQEVCRSFQKTSEAISNSLSSSHATKAEVEQALKKIVAYLDKASSQLQAIKPPSKDSVEYKKALADLHSMSTDTQRFETQFPHLTSTGPVDSWESSVKKLGENGSAAFSSIGISSCTAAPNSSSSSTSTSPSQGGSASSGSSTSSATGNASSTASTTASTSSSGGTGIDTSPTQTTNSQKTPAAGTGCKDLPKSELKQMQEEGNCPS